MRAKLVESNLPDKYIHSVKNGETSAVIPIGTPLVLNLSSTKQPSTDQNSRPAGFEDGLQVVLPATGGAFAAQYLFYGVAVSAIANPGYGESQVFGVVQSAIIKYATRANSSGGSSWSSSASIQSGQLLTIDTIDNAFTTVASNVTAASTNNQTLYSSMAGAQVILLDSIQSFAASATATNITGTVLTTLKRVFLRMM